MFHRENLKLKKHNETNQQRALTQFWTGPSENRSMLNVKGVFEYNFEARYLIKAKKTGKLKIIPPKFYSDSLELQGNETFIEITGDPLSSEELKQLKFNKFVEDYIKPKGTKRYIINDSIGYIDIFGESTWEYYRELTKKELKKLKQIKQ